MRNAILSAIIIGLLLFVSSCDQTDRETGHVVARDGEPAVHMVSGEDPDMNSAIQQARATVDTFIASLQNPAQNQTHFSVKAQIVDGGARLLDGRIHVRIFARDHMHGGLSITRDHMTCFTIGLITAAHK